MVVTKVEVIASHACVAFKDGVRVQPSDYGWGAGVLASQIGLSSNTEKISDEVSVDDMSEVRDEDCAFVVEVEALR